MPILHPCARRRSPTNINKMRVASVAEIAMAAAKLLCVFEAEHASRTGSYCPSIFLFQACSQSKILLWTPQLTRHKAIQKKQVLDVKVECWLCDTSTHFGCWARIQQTRLRARSRTQVYCDPRLPSWKVRTRFSVLVTVIILCVKRLARVIR